MNTRYDESLFLLNLQLTKYRGAKLEFLPAYSPDYNPIEQAFFVLKSKTRREGQVGRENGEDDAAV